MQKTLQLYLAKYYKLLFILANLPIIIILQSSMFNSDYVSFVLFALFGLINITSYRHLIKIHNMISYILSLKIPYVILSDCSARYNTNNINSVNIYKFYPHLDNKYKKLLNFLKKVICSFIIFRLCWLYGINKPLGIIINLNVLLLSITTIGMYYLNNYIKSIRGLRYIVLQSLWFIVVYIIINEWYDIVTTSSLQYFNEIGYPEYLADVYFRPT